MMNKMTPYLTAYLTASSIIVDAGYLREQVKLKSSLVPPSPTLRQRKASFLQRKHLKTTSKKELHRQTQKQNQKLETKRQSVFPEASAAVKTEDEEFSCGGDACGEDLRSHHIPGGSIASSIHPNQPDWTLAEFDRSCSTASFAYSYDALLPGCGNRCRGGRVGGVPVDLGGGTVPKADGPRQKSGGYSLTVPGTSVRIQALSERLLRVEPKGPLGFEDRPSFFVQGRSKGEYFELQPERSGIRIGAKTGSEKMERFGTEFQFDVYPVYRDRSSGGATGDPETPKLLLYEVLVDFEDWKSFDGTGSVSSVRVPSSHFLLQKGLRFKHNKWIPANMGKMGWKNVDRHENLSGGVTACALLCLKAATCHGFSLENGNTCMLTYSLLEQHNWKDNILEKTNNDRDVVGFGPSKAPHFLVRIPHYDQSDHSNKSKIVYDSWEQGGPLNRLMWPSPGLKQLSYAIRDFPRFFVGENGAGDTSGSGYAFDNPVVGDIKEGKNLFAWALFWWARSCAFVWYLASYEDVSPDSRDGLAFCRVFNLVFGLVFGLIVLVRAREGASTAIGDGQKAPGVGLCCLVFRPVVVLNSSQINSLPAGDTSVSGYAFDKPKKWVLRPSKDTYVFLMTGKGIEEPPKNKPGKPPSYLYHYHAARAEFLKLSGHSPLLPDWAFGVWYTAWKTYDMKKVEEEIGKWEENKLPLDVWGLDMNWRYGFGPWAGTPNMLCRQGLGAQDPELDCMDGCEKPKCAFYGGKLGAHPKDIKGSYYELNTERARKMLSGSEKDEIPFFALIQKNRLHTFFNDHPMTVHGIHENGKLQCSKEELQFRWEGVTKWLNKGLDFWWPDVNWGWRLPPPTKKYFLTDLNEDWEGMTSPAWTSHVFYTITNHFKNKNNAHVLGAKKRVLALSMPGNTDGHSKEGHWAHSTPRSMTGQTAGHHRYPIHWLGDGVGLPAAMQGLINFGVHSLRAYVTTDSGGDHLPEEFQKNVPYAVDQHPEWKPIWYAHAAYSPILRLHGNPSVPYTGEHEQVQVVKTLFDAHYALVPTILSAAFEHYFTGYPLAARCDLEWEGEQMDGEAAVGSLVKGDAMRMTAGGEEEGATALDNEHQQYLFLRHFLVAPFLDPGQTSVKLFLPPGEWENAWTGERVVGPKKDFQYDRAVKNKNDVIGLFHRVPSFAVVVDDPKLRVADQNWDQLSVEVFIPSQRFFSPPPPNHNFLKRALVERNDFADPFHAGVVGDEMEDAEKTSSRGRTSMEFLCDAGGDETESRETTSSKSAATVCKLKVTSSVARVWLVRLHLAKERDEQKGSQKSLQVLLNGERVASSSLTTITPAESGGGGHLRGKGTRPANGAGNVVEVRMDLTSRSKVDNAASCGRTHVLEVRLGDGAAANAAANHDHGAADRGAGKKKEGGGPLDPSPGGPADSPARGRPDSPGAGSGSRSCSEPIPHQDYLGGEGGIPEDVRGRIKTSVVNASGCLDACAREEGCKQWVWYDGCLVKDGSGKPQMNEAVTSGGTCK